METNDPRNSVGVKDEIMYAMSRIETGGEYDSDYEPCKVMFIMVEDVCFATAKQLEEWPMIELNVTGLEKQILGQNTNSIQESWVILNN